MTKKASLFVATPMYGGMCTGTYTVGLVNLTGVLHQHGISWHYSYMMNESLITRARNNLTHQFLRTDCTHLLFIDADIGFNPNDIPPMVHADVDVVCGIYPKKEINWAEVAKASANGVPPNELVNHTGAFVVNLINPEKEIKTMLYSPIEITNAGTGFMMIKREVFEKLKGQVPVYMTDDTYGKNTEPQPIDEFFATSIDEESKILLSEDYHFCKIARKAGFKIHAALWPDLTHTGTYQFAGRIQKRML